MKEAAKRISTSKSLRIAQVAPLTGPVSSTSTGSIEQLVWLLTEELTRQGHEVTLYAPGNSETSATLRPVYARGYGDDPDLSDWRFHEMMQMARVCEQADEFDVIHSHIYCYALPFTRLVHTPIVHTYHVTPPCDIVHTYAQYPEANLVAISIFQRQSMAGLPSVPVIHNGIDTDAFQFQPASGDYLLYLGHITPSKGPLEAIQVAKRTGMRIVLAGGKDKSFFQEHVAPFIDGNQVQYVGLVGACERNRLLAGAAALIYPLRESEPFGLVMIEAMASGTPVAALKLGAVPEIVENGVTGYHADDLETLIALLPDVLSLDRTRVREAVIQDFDYRRMAAAYAAHYRCILSAQER